MQAVRWSQILAPGLLAGFVAIVLVLIAALMVGLASLRNVHAASEAVVHTYSVKVSLEQLLAMMLDAESGERGFLITGTDTHLEPYERARATIPSEIAKVRALTADNREQQADLDLLSAAAYQKIGELTEAIRQRREVGLAAAQTTVATNIGKRTMDGMRAIVVRMEAREDALLAIRTAQAAQSYRAAVLTSMVASGVALLAVIALFFGTLRYGIHRLRATGAAEAQQARLREALQHKDEFVALVSHELRTPTNTIAGWAKMLEDGTMRPDRAEKAITAISRNADSLRQLVDDLMDTSQLVAGRMRLTIGAVDLRDVVRDAIDAVRLSADNKGVTLRADAQHGQPLMMRGDPGRLKQVVWNLLVNAVKFTPKGGQVDISLTSTDRGLRLEVRDSGAGIDPAFLPHVFERYRQAAPSSTTNPRGLGLGLAIVRHLVELHGGTVTAHSAGLGQGSTFVIELPPMLATEIVPGQTASDVAVS